MLHRFLRAAQPIRAAGRRLAHTEAKQTAKGDTPWIIGSALVFIPATIWITSPKDSHAHHAVEKAIPPNLRNYGVSRPLPKEEEAEPVAAEAPATPEPSEASDSELKTSRESAPDATTLESLATDEQSEHSSSKEAASLQPESGKLDKAVEVSTQGEHHDPKAGVAAHETAKEAEGSN